MQAIKTDADVFQIAKMFCNYPHIFWSATTKGSYFTQSSLRSGVTELTLISLWATHKEGRTIFGASMGKREINEVGAWEEKKDKLQLGQGHAGCQIA